MIHRGRLELTFVYNQSHSAKYSPMKILTNSLVQMIEINEKTNEKSFFFFRSFFLIYR